MKHDFFSPKAISNRMKAKGLQKLRWYCQMCEKQCRDENGFKCHCASESHQRQMMLFSDNPRKYLENFSREFQASYLRQLSRSHGTKRVNANMVYQELIANKNHLHMNATRWGTLTEFITHLGREGFAHVEETEKGWFITWIDNSPEALARKAAIQKKERSQKTDEERERKILQEQVQRAKKEVESEVEEEATELKRDNEGEPLKLTLNVKAQDNTNSSKVINKPFNLFKKKEVTNKPLSLNALAKLKQDLKKEDLAKPKEVEKKPRSNLEEIILEEKNKKGKY